ncbi:MAG: OmpA family protein, partial [Oscillospiraceae bacterium]
SVNAEKWQVIVKSFDGETKVETPQQFVVNPGKSDKPGSGILPNGDNAMPITSPDDVQKFDDLYEYLKNYVESNNLQNDVEVMKGEGYAFITFRNNIFFDGDSSTLKPEGKKILDILCQAFVNITDQIGKVSFEGHTARSRDAETANDLIMDRQLSSERAVNALCYVQQKNILDGKRLTSTGHGEFMPVVAHDGSEATRIKNRRVEIYIIKSGEKEISLDEVYQKINAEIAAKS